jgi:hypothetical protein
MKEEQCKTTAGYNDRPTTSITIEIPVDLLEHLKERAALEETGYQDIINCYLQEGMISDTAIIKRKRYAEHIKGVLEKHGVPPEAITDIFSKFIY